MSKENLKQTLKEMISDGEIRFSLYFNEDINNLSLTIYIDGEEITSEETYIVQ